MLTLDRIYQAAHTIKGVVRKTDLILSPNIAAGCELYLKAENLQITGSFKVRGAYFKMAMLPIPIGQFTCAAVANPAQPL